MGSSIIVNRARTSQEDGAHKDLTLDGLSVGIGVPLGHHTTEGVACDQDVIASKTCLFDQFDGLGHVAIDQDRLGCVKKEFWKTNPDFLAVCGALRLNLSSKISVA